MLCCAVLCCVVLCHVMSRCAMLCCIVLRYAVLCCKMNPPISSEFSINDSNIDGESSTTAGRYVCHLGEASQGGRVTGSYMPESPIPRCLCVRVAIAAAKDNVAFVSLSLCVWGGS